MFICLFFAMSEYSMEAFMSVRLSLSATFLILTETVVLLNPRELMSSAPMQSAPAFASWTFPAVNVVAHVAITPAIAMVTAMRRTEAMSGETPLRNLIVNVVAYIIIA